MRRLLLLLAACGDSSSAAMVDGATDGTPDTCATTTPWASAPGLPRGATQETAVVTAGGKIYVIGGFDGNIAVVDAVQVFDPVACTWSMGPALPKPVHHANAAVVDGTIYVVGAMQTIQFAAIGDVWAYKPGDAAWTPKAAMPNGSQRGAAVTGVIDGKIYVAGGLRANAAVSDVSLYDPAADAWSALPALPMTRDHGCGGAANGRLYVIGGRQANITTQSPIVFEFTPGGSWVERTAMPTARGGTACSIVGNRIVVTGGEGNANAPSGVFPETEVYDAVANTWATLAPMMTPRHGTGSAAIGNKVYVPGGATKQAFGAVATHEILTVD